MGQDVQHFDEQTLIRSLFIPGDSELEEILHPSKRHLGSEDYFSYDPSKEFFYDASKEASRSKDLIGAAMGGTVLGFAARSVFCAAGESDPCKDGTVVFLGGFAIGAILGAGIASGL